MIQRKTPEVYLSLTVAEVKALVAHETEMPTEASRLALRSARAKLKRALATPIIHASASEFGEL
jgi:hypothetical protein